MTGVPPNSGRLPAVFREWRIPPWQPALLFVVVAAVAAYDLYGSPSLTTILVTVFLAVVFTAMALLAARYLLVADDDGVWVRGLTGEKWVAWPELESAEVVRGRRGSTTVRIVRVDGSFVDVPPSLLLPSVPTKIDKARAIMYDTAAALNEMAAARRGR